MKTNKTLKTIALGAGLVGAGLLSGNVANASEVHTNNSVDAIKAEMHKQQGDKQHLAVYRVQKGDTLSGIAQASGLTMDKILEMNDIPNPNLIHIGQLINLGYGTQANNFVAQKGQSAEHNAKDYKVPTSAKAKASMNATKESANKGTADKTVANNGGSQQGTTSNSGQALAGGQQTSNGSVANNGGQQAVASQPSNSYKPVYNQSASNNGGSQQLAGGNQGTTSNGTVNNGGQTGTVNGGGQQGGNQGTQTPSKPSTGGNQGTQTPSKPSTGGNQGTQTPSKPSTGGNQGTQTPSKPSTGGNQGTQTPSKPDNKPSQNQGYNTEEINKAYQEHLSNKGGWNGQWMTSSEGYDNSGDGREGYAEANVPSQMGSQFAGQYLGDATLDTNGSSLNDFKYGYSHTTEKDGTLHTDYKFWN